jgi:hypothetical protein
MFFLNNKEIDYNYVYLSNLRFIFLKQNYSLNNSYLLKKPNINFFFIFNKILDLNLLKIYNNLLII